MGIANLLSIEVAVIYIPLAILLNFLNEALKASNYFISFKCYTELYRWSLPLAANIQ